MGAHHAAFLAAISIRTGIVLAWLFFGLRVLGKRHVGQMNIYDLALIMALANSVQNAMTNGKGDLSIGLVSAGTLLLIGWTASVLFLRLPKLEDRLIGTPTVLIHNGHIEREHLRREHVTETELMTAIRQYGLPDTNDVKLAVLEVDGSISIVPRAQLPQG